MHRFSMLVLTLLVANACGDRAPTSPGSPGPGTLNATVGDSMPNPNPPPTGTLPDTLQLPPAGGPWYGAVWGVSGPGADSASAPVRRVAGSLVRLVLESDGSEVARATGDANGAFALGGLPDGRFRLLASPPAVQAAAYRDGELSPIVIQGGRLVGLRWLNVVLPRR